MGEGVPSPRLLLLPLLGSIDRIGNIRFQVDLSLGAVAWPEALHQLTAVAPPPSPLLLLFLLGGPQWSQVEQRGVPISNPSSPPA